MRSRGVFLALILLAGALRFPGLGARPMHADEAVHADKFGTLLEGGGYVYDPSDYHGPSLYYLTLPSAWLQGATAVRRARRGHAARGARGDAGWRSSPPTSEPARSWALSGAFGRGPARRDLARAWSSTAATTSTRPRSSSSASARCSPGARTSGGRALSRPCSRARASGSCTRPRRRRPSRWARWSGRSRSRWLVDRWRGRPLPDARAAVRGRDVLLALLAAVLVSCLLFSSFLSHPDGRRGFAPCLRALREAGGRRSWHFHPWDYYLRLLVHFPATGTPFWTEGLILGTGGRRGHRRLEQPGAYPGADARVLRFLLALHAADARPLLLDSLQDPVVPAGVPARDDPPGWCRRRRPGAGAAAARARPWSARC